jgi:Ala-tRNA(Pro) deacylase
MVLNRDCFLLKRFLALIMMVINIQEVNQMTKGSAIAYQELLDELQKLDIKYEMVDHPAAKTTAEADAYIAGKIGVRTKSMFLKDKKKNFYLVIMDDAKRMDFKEFQELTGTKRISMAHDSDIEDQLGLEAGIVSPFGIMNNAAHNLQIYFDQDMLDENIPLTFHPNINTHTIFLSAADLMKFIKAQGFDYQIIDL